MTNEQQLTEKIQKVICQYDVYENVSPLYCFIKRFIDFSICLVAFICLSPVFLLVALAIRLESKGSVIFKQKRVGINGKIFTIYKFRSMYQDAEKRLEELKSKNQIKGHMFKMKDDPRVTKVGKIIRRTSLDELPQIFNILKGDMALIGPRPPLVREVEQYESWQYMRLSVIPGLSGLWQISGRNALSFDQMVRLDMHYIKKRSLVFDFLIFFNTFKVLFFDKSAF